MPADNETLGSPDETRGGSNIEAAIANAEEGSVVEGGARSTRRRRGS